MPYGSEWHLLRYLGRHRSRLDEEIRRATGGEILAWLDFRFLPAPGQEYFGAPSLDAEWKALDFLADDMRASVEWRDFWPQRGNQPNWDAVGLLRRNDQVDLLLVEAKAHIGELQSFCQAREDGGRPQIATAFENSKRAFEVAEARDWFGPYYQFCNRLTTLHFLMSAGVGARLLFIYFCGDDIPGCNCPPTPLEWEAPLAEMYARIGLTHKSRLEQRIHQMYLPVGG